MPFSFYFNPYLTIVPKNYHPVEYYNYLIEIMEHLSSSSMMMKRMSTGSRLEVRLVHTSRRISTKLTLKRMRNIKKLLDTDSQFRRFHEGMSEEVPMFYNLTIDRNLGSYAELLTKDDRTPIFNEGFDTDRLPRY